MFYLAPFRIVWNCFAVFLHIHIGADTDIILFLCLELADGLGGCLVLCDLICLSPFCKCGICCYLNLISGRLLADL